MLVAGVLAGKVRGGTIESRGRNKCWGTGNGRVRKIELPRDGIANGNGSGAPRDGG